METGNYAGKHDDVMGNFTNDACGCSRATQVLKESLRLINLKGGFVLNTTMNDSISLLLLWMHTLTRQQSNLNCCQQKNVQNAFDSTTKLARTDTAWGTGSEVLNR